MKTGTRFVFLTLFILCAVQCSCSVGNSGHCSPSIVTLDAGIDGLPDVGEFGSPELCRVICGYQTEPLLPCEGAGIHVHDVL